MYIKVLKNRYRHSAYETKHLRKISVRRSFQPDVFDVRAAGGVPGGPLYRFDAVRGSAGEDEQQEHQNVCG